MNADEIRAGAIERVARGQYEGWRAEMLKLCAADPFPDDPPPSAWEEADERVKDGWRNRARHDIDALGDLLPTGVETQRTDSIYRLPNGRLVGASMRRYVTDWQDVVDEQ